MQFQYKFSLIYNLHVLTGFVKNGCEYGFDDGDEDEQWDDFCGMWRTGLEGADRWGLRPPSLSLQELLGGVGGSGRESTLTEIKYYLMTFAE